MGAPDTRHSLGIDLPGNARVVQTTRRRNEKGESRVLNLRRKKRDQSRFLLGFGSVFTPGS